MTVDQVIKIMHGNAANARKLIMAWPKSSARSANPVRWGSETMLDSAVITAPEKRDPA